MKNRISTYLILCFMCFLQAQGKIHFSDWFENQTLRLDYILSGDSVQQHVSLDQMYRLPYWAGRQNNLDSLYVQGNGQILVRDAETNTLIYATSFSTLFQEWQHTPEACEKTKSFENCFNIPMPKKKAKISLSLSNDYQETTEEKTFLFDPKDILIHSMEKHSVQPHYYVQKSGDEAHCIDVAFVAEGYTKEQMNIFRKDVDSVCAHLFAHEPYKHLKNKFNIIAVESASKNEGTSIPSQNQWKETVLGSAFDTFYSERYLTTLNVKKLHDVLTGIPFEQIIILVNTEKYGGGGIYNFYMLSSAHHRMSMPVCVHEFGHSFAGLADEYAYASDGSTDYYHASVEPWEKNITTLKDFQSKWADMVKKGTPLPTPQSKDKKVQNTRVGLFEGAGYMMKGVYRPVQECRMKINEVPNFCPVCQRATQQIIEYNTK